MVQTRHTCRMRNYFRIPGSVCAEKPGAQAVLGQFLEYMGFNRPASLLCSQESPGLSLRLDPHLSVPAAANSAIQPSVDSLFNSCRNPKTGISEDDYAEAAKTLKVEVEAIKAVALVETKGSAFNKDGHPTILFERHYFHRFTGGKYDKTHPDLSNASAGGYGKFSAQYPKLERAYKLDPEAALKSASWGRFQIMGSNHVASGHGTVRQFVQSQMAAEINHLRAFVALVNSDNNLLNALRKKDWAKFAKGYNGPGYKKNDYDTKMKETYEGLLSKNKDKKPAK